MVTKCLQSVSRDSFLSFFSPPSGVARFHPPLECGGRTPHLPFTKSLEQNHFLCIARASCSSVQLCPLAPHASQPQGISEAGTREAALQPLDFLLRLCSSWHTQGYSFFLTSLAILHFISLRNPQLFLITELWNSR